MDFLIDAGVVVLVAGAVTVLVLGLWEGRIAPILGAAKTAAASDGAKGVMSAALKRIGRQQVSLLPPKVRSWIERQIAQAGDADTLTPAELIGMSELSAFAGVALGGFVWASEVVGGPWVFIAPAMLGAALPWIWLDEQVKTRRLAISRALPFSLDLLTLSVEAGLDFASAMAKVVEKGRAGPLRDELAWVTRLLRMGRTREEALKALADKVRLPAITRFVSAVVQADRMGTGLGKTLRIQAEQLRVERTQRAEKLANQAPVKMLFPLVAFIFPNVFAVLFGPIVFSLLGF